MPQPQSQQQQGRRGNARRRQRIQNRVARQAERRQREQERFTEPLTPKAARKVARSQAATEFRPTERQIASEIRGSKKREGELGQWWDSIGQGYQQDQANSLAAMKVAEDATNQRIAEESQRSQAGLASLAAADKSFAELVGGPTNAAGIATMAGAAAAADRQRVTLQAPITASRANYIASIGSRRNAAGLQGVESRQAERERRRKQQQDLQALKRERGSAVVKSLQTLREQEQDRKTQKEAFGSKEHYNRALEQQSRLGYKGTARSAAAQEAAAAAYSHARERGASAQEATAAANKAAARIKGEAQENTARIYGKNAGKNQGGYTVAEAESLVKQAGVSFKSPGEAIDYLVNRGVKRGRAKKAVHGVLQQSKGRGR
ncbi:MAG TPA: hypothetical protein VF009_06875 [Solirubrobacterales bacterium]